jgi:hypothetical protein
MRRMVRLAFFTGALVAAIALLAGGASAATATGTVRLDPPTQQVAQGGTFNVKIISNSSIPISGVSASIMFDKTIVQVTTITRSAAWAAAPLFLAADATAISTANQKGYLKNVAVSFFPPTNVPAGDQDFITVGFKAVGCGTVNMTLPISKNQTDATMLDGRANTYGAAMKVTTTGGSVTVCQGGGAGASGSPGASDSAAPGDSGGALPSDSSGPGSSESPGANGGGPLASAPPSSPPGAGAGTTTGSGGGDQQSQWLTFAIAALAISAAGLAALILVITVVAIVAAVIGASFVIRSWRKWFPAGPPTEAAATAPEGASAGAAVGAPAGAAAATGTTPAAEGAAASTASDPAAPTTAQPTDAGASPAGQTTDPTIAPNALPQGGTAG